ncbi:MMPL family transporter [Hydrogenovibrio sp. 3SP14C1]|uniref:MMPL family transporter n=1 Tax=Hydrogenovibrio sp. 3SP14C1 TaxID=3038774 RepID=UPI0024168D52|nr:MMPL family transporter [Hydrogenovibrio sp. 3SP14C1]MDG4811615.1 MMPL family transporter [Hydrogenovibrio sp. 3SP14C1]
MLLILAGVALFGLPKLTIQNQLTAFFPSATTSDQAVLLQTLKNSLSDQARTSPLMVSIRLPKQMEISKMTRFSEDLRASLLTETAIESVQNQSPSLAKWNKAPLRGYRYLLSDFELEALPENIETLWQAWQLGVVLDKSAALSDPSQQWGGYLGQSHIQGSPSSHNGIWVSTNSSDKTHSLLMLMTFKPGHQMQGLETIKTVLSEKISDLLGNDQAQQVVLKLSNAAWIGQQAKKEIQQEIKWLSVLATLFILGFLLWAFRNVYWVLLSFIPLVAATLISTVTVNVIFGSVEALTLALGVVLIGVTVDYPIHAFAAYRKNRLFGMDAWPIIRLGGITSLVGFLCLLFLDIKGIQQMGVFASMGILIALLMTRLILWQLHQREPSVALVDITPNSTKAIESTAKFEWKLWLPLMFLIGWVLWMKPIAWQDDLANLSPVPPKLLQQDGALRQQFQQTEASQFLVIQAGSIEALLQQQEALQLSLAELRKQGMVSGTLTLANWLPSQALQKKRQQALPEKQAVINVLQQTDTPLKLKYFGGFLEEISRSQSLEPLTLDTFKPLALDWQQALLPLLVSESEKGVTGKILLQGVTDTAAIAQWAQPHSLLYFNQRHLVADLVSELRHQLLWVIAVLLLVFWVFLSVQRRNISQAWQILMPVVTGVSLTLVTLIVLGQQVTIFHLLASLLVIAIGLDYSLFGHRARDLNNSLHSVNIALLTTVLSFGFLLLTEIPILIAIGQTLVIGVLWIYGLTRLQNRV